MVNSLGGEGDFKQKKRQRERQVVRETPVILKRMRRAKNNSVGV